MYYTVPHWPVKLISYKRLTHPVSPLDVAKFQLIDLFEESIELQFALIAQNQGSVLPHTFSCSLKPLLQRPRPIYHFFTRRHSPITHIRIYLHEPHVCMCLQDLNCGERRARACNE